jgi:carboxylesterase
MLIQTAEPFFFPGNSTGCLLIHGLTGSPKEMRPLGEFLSEEGYTVLGIRLFGHATKIEDMRRAQWQDWSASVLDGWHLLQTLTEDIFLIGLSMGGVLALYHASFLPTRGVVALSTPYQIRGDFRVKLLPILSHIMPYFSKGESDWQDPLAAMDHFSYPMWPTNGVRELLLLLKEMNESLPKVTAPALIMQSKLEKLIIPENMDQIYQALGTTESHKKKVLLEDSGHVITRDKEKLAVFNNVHDFIKQVMDSNQ